MTLCGCATRCREAGAGTMSSPARPGGRHMSTHSGAASLWVEEAPGHGADVVEESQGGGCVGCVRSNREPEETEVDVDLLRGAVGDAEVVEPVASGSTVTLCEIGWNR